MLSKALLSAQAFFLALFPATLCAEAASSVSLVGWPLNTNDMGSGLVESDVLLGDLLCPALTRLNLLREKSELSLLSSLQVQDNEWILKLAESYWWDGRRVQLTDLKVFTEKELPAALRELSRGSWEIPEFSATVKDDSVVIRWEKKPQFGPYVFDRIPFKTASNQALGFQCAGALQPIKKGPLWVLEGKKEPSITIHSEVPVYQKKYPKPSIAFRFADEMHPPGWARQIEESVSCDRPLDLPLMTLIAWNPEGRYTKDERFRKAMTHLLPRGSLLRAGAGGLGDLISAPFMRAHPGYKKSLLVLPYDPKAADSLLNQMGFTRSKNDGFRQTPEGQRFELRLSTADMAGTGLLRKVMDDSFRALGINATFTDKQDASVDGVLVGLSSSWPEADLSPLLHSKSSQGAWPWNYGDPELDKALEAYNLSLTQERPDFRLLEKIHELVYKREPFSVLVQHRVCVAVDTGKKSQQKIVIRNPDWFRELFDF